MWFRDFLGPRWWHFCYCHWAWSWSVGWHPAEPQPIPREELWKFPCTSPLYLMWNGLDVSFTLLCKLSIFLRWRAELDLDTAFSILIHFRFIQWHTKIFDFFFYFLKLFHNHDFSLYFHKIGWKLFSSLGPRSCTTLLQKLLLFSIKNVSVWEVVPHHWEHQAFQFFSLHKSEDLYL